MEKLIDDKVGYYPYYIKKVDGQFYLYNIFTNGIFLLNQREYDILNGDTDIDAPENIDVKNILQIILY